MPSKWTGCPVSIPNGTMSSISKSITLPIAHAVEHPVVDDFDRRTLDTEHLADERRKSRHRAAHRPAEDADELVHLVVGRALVDEHAELPVPIGHHLGRVGDRRHVQAAHVGSFDLT